VNAAIFLLQNLLPKFLLIAGFFFSTVNSQAQETKPDKKEPEKKEAEKVLTVPFELLKSRHMAIQVKINGNGPYRLIFDTGAPTNLINTRIAKDSGLMKKDERGGGFGIFSMPGKKTINTLEIGDVKLEKMPVMVMDHPTVAAISNALGPIDGLIGFPFFARYKTTIDYQKREMTLEPNGYIPGDAMEALMNKMMSAQGGKPEPAIVAPAGLWGFGIDKEEKDEDAGVMVKEVMASGPAATGGLKKGDRILTIDGRWTDTIADTYTATSLVKPGRTVIVVVKRDGKEVKLSIKPVKGA
jgi:hypothetical protein